MSGYNLSYITMSGYKVVKYQICITNLFIEMNRGQGNQGARKLMSVKSRDPKHKAGVCELNKDKKINVSHSVLV